MVCVCFFSVFLWAWASCGGWLFRKNRQKRQPIGHNTNGSPEEKRCAATWNSWLVLFFFFSKLQLTSNSGYLLLINCCIHVARLGLYRCFVLPDRYTCSVGSLAYKNVVLPAVHRSTFFFSFLLHFVLPSHFHFLFKKIKEHMWLKENLVAVAFVYMQLQSDYNACSCMSSDEHARCNWPDNPPPDPNCSGFVSNAIAVG